MRSAVGLVQVVKWPFLMAWSGVFLAGINSVVWYHLVSYGLLLADRALSASGCFFLVVWYGLMVRLT